MQFFFGIVILVVAAVMTVHDASYIFKGNMIDLNAHLAGGGEIPRDDYVEYSAAYCLGNYAESKEYIDGLIPVPWSKTQEYAFIVPENGMIISAQVKKGATIEELDELTEWFFSDDSSADVGSVKLSGCLNSIDPEMMQYLESYLQGSGVTDDFELTYYCIDTTRTRTSLAVMYSIFALIGVAVIIAGVKKIS